MTCFSLRRPKVQTLDRSEELLFDRLLKWPFMVLLSPLDVVLLPGQLGVTLVELVHD